MTKKQLISIFVFFILSISIIGCTNQVSNSQPQSSPQYPPEQTVKTFYSDLMNRGGSLLAEDNYLKSPFLSENAKESISKTIKNFEMGGAFDPFLCAQDTPQSVSVGSTTVDETKASVSVTTSFGNQILITLVAEDDTWLIDSFTCQ